MCCHHHREWRRERWHCSCSCSCCCGYRRRYDWFKPYYPYNHCDCD